MVKQFHIYIGFFLCLVWTASCAEEKQYSHREEIITQKIWEEDSMHTVLLLNALEDTLPADTSLISPDLDSISTPPKSTLSP